jgi:hypothetical protein
VSFHSPDSLADRDAPPRALVEALREEPIDAVRMQSAYLRFLQRRAAPPSWWRARGVARWAAFAVVIGVGSAYAANLIRPFSSSPQRGDEGAPALVPTVAPRVTKLRARTHKETSPDASASPEAAASAMQEQTRSEAEQLGREIDGSPTGVGHEQPSRSPAAVASAEQWKRAARGLRDGDFQSANAALKELTRRGTEADRESAQLVQAQVLLAQGREAEAGSLLKSLEASAHAPSVRRKSAELLARLRDRAAAPRAAKSRPGTELP